jgi:DNA helicase II / ATP-dependent DNA helicase PcrA
MSDPLSGLNPEQQTAVTWPHRHALVLAGAGSGKTRVLTSRIAWLIQTGQVTPFGVLAVTFTNKAAKEMLTRISAMMAINTRGMWVGTFHGLCNRLLRAHHQDAGLPQLFQILDAQDQLAAIKRLLKALNVDTERFEPRKVQYFISGNKEAGLRAKDVEAHDDFTRRMVEFYEAYDAQCQREGVVDFAELLLRSVELLERNALLRDHYRARFRHILVDEFQDTSKLQYRWLKLLAGEDTAVFAVGDDDQSIYAFRGANIGNMHDFRRDFGIGDVIRLEQNYRSHGFILEAANRLIEQNAGRLGKNLWTAEGKGESLRLYQALTDLEEAGFIVQEIGAMRAEGVSPTGIALLYRSNAQSRVLEHALFSAGIPYRVYGGLRFFERQEIKHALAYLRLIASPEDEGAFLRVVNFPARGIGARTLENLADNATRAGTSLWQAACSKSTGKSPSTKGTGLSTFVALIESMRQVCESLPLPEQVEHIIETSGLKTYYENEREGQDRLENLNELITAAALLIQEDQEDRSLTAFGSDVTPAGLVSAETLQHGVLARFLAHAALEAGEHQAGEGLEAVQLMTVHAAKGLEFHAVFISGLEEGLFPHEQSASEYEGLEEERRLMYVAITRARRRLYLTHAQSRMLHGQTRYGVESRFLSELPEQAVKRINGMVRQQAAVPSWGRTSPEFVPKESGSSGWKIGQNVLHPKFGEGVILSLEGRGSDGRVQVKFPGQPPKWLALEYARLSAL